MKLLFLFFLGFLFSFAGSITPSLLNMTALKVSLTNGKKAAYKYAFAVAIIVVPQIIIAVTLTNFLADNPSILVTLEKIATIIFIFLSYYYYKESRKSKIKIAKINSKKENPFLTGIILSILNMFSIPFYCGVIILLNAYNIFNYSNLDTFIFTISSVLGTFYILFFYGKYAKIIQQKTGKLTKDINLVLSILTGFVALFSILKMFF
ncbi:LysE family transporter [uncultured Polaribacter sp.]|uniref:LysE family transporter n=1 Tax=uncultured Polaribacter sp. TaxID=174711 RepID=UPI00262114FF|nr:LysE family transporter [uncultured Polaribacter sp.]